MSFILFLLLPKLICVQVKTNFSLQSIIWVCKRNDVEERIRLTSIIGMVNREEKCFSSLWVFFLQSGRFWCLFDVLSFGLTVCSFISHFFFLFFCGIPIPHSLQIQISKQTLLPSISYSISLVSLIITSPVSANKG